MSGCVGGWVRCATGCGRAAKVGVCEGVLPVPLVFLQEIPCPDHLPMLSW